MKMMNNEGPHSEYFDELCALAAIGQIGELEFVELQDHMQNCAQCRSSYGEFIDLIHNKLPLVDPELSGSNRLAGFPSAASSYRERFSHARRKAGPWQCQEQSYATPQPWKWKRVFLD